MTPEDRRAVLLVLAFSIISLIWSWFAFRPYWFLLSGAAMVWTVRAMGNGRVINPIAAFSCGASLAFVPAVGVMLGQPSAEFLEVLFSPLMAYSLSLWVISSTLLAQDGYSSGTQAFLTFMLTVSMGTIALLSLYYLDAIFFTDLIPFNGALMWPLTSLLFGSLTISISLRASGMEETVLGSREAER